MLAGCAAPRTSTGAHTRTCAPKTRSPASHRPTTAACAAITRRNTALSAAASLGWADNADALFEEAYDLALLRYREGIGNYLQVLSAETPLLAQQSLDADLRSRQLALEIDLVRALGGGFDEAALSVAAAH